MRETVSKGMCHKDNMALCKFSLAIKSSARRSTQPPSLCREEIRLANRQNRSKGPIGPRSNSSPKISGYSFLFLLRNYSSLAILFCVPNYMLSYYYFLYYLHCSFAVFTILGVLNYYRIYPLDYSLSLIPLHFIQSRKVVL